MQYLVDMRTRVPGGTPRNTVDTVRADEATRASELIADGHLERLWRVSTLPDQWRTFGLFRAADDAHLDRVLSSMPLHVWRTDDVTALSAHPNDPGRTRGAQRSEFFTTLTITVPDRTTSEEILELTAAEATRARELAQQGRMLRLWTLPPATGHRRVLGLWSADDHEDLTIALKSLPLFGWMTVEATQSFSHPSDPVNGRTR